MDMPQVGAATTNRDACLAQLFEWHSPSFSDCKNNDWIFNNAVSMDINPELECFDLRLQRDQCWVGVRRRSELLVWGPSFGISNIECWYFGRGWNCE